MAPRYCIEAEAERWERLGLALDRYGETDTFACLRCGEASLKVSVPVHAAHCTACGWSPKDVTVAERLEKIVAPKLPKRIDVDLRDIA